MHGSGGGAAGAGGGGAFSELCAGLVSSMAPSASPAAGRRMVWPPPVPADDAASYPLAAGASASSSIPAAVSAVASAGPPEGFAPGFCLQRIVQSRGGT